MHIGQYISGIAHTGLVGWVLFGGVLQPDPPPMEVTDVSVISSAEFDALLRVQDAPEAVTEVAVPVAPEDVQQAPALPTQVDDAPEPAPPPEVPAPEPEDSPEPADVVPPTPVAPQDLLQDAPILTAPAPEAAPLVPDVPVRPVAQPAERVAPEPVAPPEPDRAVAETVQDATQPDEQGPSPEERREETAPDAASTEIATEPKREELASAAPSRSLRPRLRPEPKPVLEPEPAPVVKTDEAALAAALAEASQPEVEAPSAAPSGPPLSQGERDGLRVAVQQCWAVDVGSRAADVTVVVGFSLDKSGKVQGDIRLLSAEGGDAGAAQTAFGAARRAILRCQKNGYDLPAEKYDHWQDVEITFNPDNMRRR